MKTTVLVAALLAAISMPALAEDVINKTDEVSSTTKVDPATTGSTQQSDMKTTVSKDGYSGCMKRRTALMM